MDQQIRVLLVDDEATVHTTFELATRKRSWQLDSVESAEEALELIRDKEFDVALVDKNLPEMNGVELIREIRKTNHHMGIVMITGFASTESAVETLHLGIDGYVEKPFDDIFKVVEKVESVAAARNKGRLDGDAAVANLHFRMAIEALRGETARASRPPEKPMKILVASDLDSDREWLIGQFGDSTNIQSATSPQGALATARAERPGLLLVDIAMQDMDILNFLSEFKMYAPRANVVLIAESMPPLNVIGRLIDFGVRVIIDKPLDEEMFRTKLEYVAREAGHGTDPIDWSNEQA